MLTGFNFLLAKENFFSNEDYLLLSGDPIIMGLCMMVASEKTNGILKMLKWEKREKDYYAVTVDYYDKES